MENTMTPVKKQHHEHIKSNYVHESVALVHAGRIPYMPTSGCYDRDIQTTHF